ncbi:hypothetical protein ACFQ6S_12910 [Streptomyces sp. NPDC056479]|uniref:hypothetical protein n=1 Tax=Streptomyces sp. NPDC056479 TaxID=3345832 RepID=UPI00368064C1
MPEGTPDPCRPGHPTVRVGRRSRDPLAVAGATRIRRGRYALEPTGARRLWTLSEKILANAG